MGLSEQTTKFISNLARNSDTIKTAVKRLNVIDLEAKRLASLINPTEDDIKNLRELKEEAQKLDIAFKGLMDTLGVRTLSTSINKMSDELGGLGLTKLLSDLKAITDLTVAFQNNLKFFGYDNLLNKLNRSNINTIQQKLNSFGLLDIIQKIDGLNIDKTIKNLNNIGLVDVADSLSSLGIVKSVRAFKELGLNNLEKKLSVFNE